MSTSYRPECGVCNNSILVESPQSTVRESSCCTAPVQTTCCNTCNNTPCTCSQQVTQTRYVWIPPTTQQVVAPSCSCPTTTEQCHCTPTCNTCTCKLYVTNTSTFIVPDCGSAANMYVEDSSKLVVGAYLYADSVGYLKIVNIIDGTTIQVELTQAVCDSNCNVVSPGSSIAACTKFIMTALGCGGASSPYISAICLVTCFYAPAREGTVTIGVSQIGNIVSGSIVTIGGYNYTVVTVIDSETIVIRNDGDGAPTNTYFDCEDDCTYTVTVITQPSPCENEPVDEGLIVVCDGETQTTLQGSIQNQIAVWNEERGIWVLEVLDQGTIDCTTMTACLILDPAADPQYYLIEVEDSSIFEKPEYQQFGSLLIYINDSPFIIIEVVDATHIRVQPFFEVTEITEYDAGTVICIADCCEQCKPTVETMGRYGGQEGEPSEKLIVVQDIGFSIPNGISVRNFYTGVGLPTPAAETDASVAPPTDDGLFDIYYTNEGACKKYIELTTNWASVLDIPTGVYANIEYRSGNSKGDTQSFAAIPVIGNDDMGIADPADVGYVSPNQPGNLFQSSLKDLNTYKAMLYDRDFVDPAEEVRFYGHIRLTFNNTTGAPVAANFEANIRAWYKSWDFILGPVEPVL